MITTIFYSAGQNNCCVRPNKKFSNLIINGHSSKIILIHRQYFLNPVSSTDRWSSVEKAGGSTSSTVMPAAQGKKFLAAAQR